MKHQKFVCVKMIGAYVIMIAALSCSVVLAARRAADRVVSAETLGGRDRYLVHVATDKPIYRVGETVFVRATVLHAATRAPHPQREWINVDIKGPRGDTVASGQGLVQDGVGGYSWTVPAGQAGGEYTLSVVAPNLGTPPAVRKFDIRGYRLPRINTQIEFFREGYGPDDTVSAVIEAVRAEGGIPAQAAVTIVARLDGEEIHRSTGVIDAEGRCMAMFELPHAITIGDGTLAFSIDDGGVVETATKTIPILLQTVDLRIYPEGGDLVAGLPARVYLEARTPNARPADIAGVVMNDLNEQVGAFRTDHEGRGRFDFTPVAGQTYRIEITEPTGIDRVFDLPAALPAGATIRTVSDVYPRGKPVTLRVISNLKGPLSLTLSQREEEIASLSIRGSATAGEAHAADATLTPSASASGVLIATVWDAEGNPLAERLIYREPSDRVHVALDPDRKRYTPGDTVQLTVSTTDDDGRPVGSVVGVTVTDESVLEMIEKRSQAPRLPVMALLEPEVREIADTHVYLDPTNPDAPRALDLLLGTQGWRRFALVNFDAFINDYGDDARRALAVRRPTPIPPLGSIRGHVRRKNGRLVENIGAVVDAVAAVPPPEAVARPAEPPDPAASPFIIAGEQARLEEPAADLDFIGGQAEMARRPSSRQHYVAVREYAHTARPGRQPNDRVDFTETLFWCAAVKTDPETGQAVITFDLNDAVTGFRATADAFTTSGALGSGETLIESVQPFYIEPKLPLEVTMGDRITLPIGFVNAGDRALNEVLTRITAARGIRVGDIMPFAVAAGERTRRLVDLHVGDTVGDTEFSIDVAAAPYADRVTRALRVVPRGFPVEQAAGAMLDAKNPMRLQYRIPETRVPGSLSSAIIVYPTPLANMTEALERLIRQPHGCFEQTSSTTYPLVMAQQYFMTHHGIDPKLIERSREMLEQGYRRLTGFECKSGGFEWFGHDPGHETLTAYGLLLFTDMAKVYPVDTAMVRRSREWLMGARDGKGGFKRERRALHTWIEDRDCSNAFITWALLASGEAPAGLTDEIATVQAAALASRNSYVIALGANVAWLAGDHRTARRLMDKLADLQDKTGRVDGATASIVGSRGQSLGIETDSLAALAWLRDDAYAANVERVIRRLADTCKGGRFGSTQSTVLALRAIVAYDAARAGAKAPGSLRLFVNGRAAGSAIDFNDQVQQAIELPDIAELLEPGEHAIELRMTDGSPMPVSVTIRYADERPASSPECVLDIRVTLSDTIVSEGEILEATVALTNREEDEIVPMPLAIVGIPGGLEVSHDHMKELVAAGRIAAYEVIGRDVVLYWRDLQAGQTVETPLRLVAEIPGVYTGPASRAYLYYADEFKTWIDPLRVTITPAE